MSTPLSVLIGDVDPTATRPLQVELQRRGARVEVVATAGELVRRAGARPPDLLVLDESLTGGGGLDLAGFPDTEIILLHQGGDLTPHGSGMGLLLSAHKPVSTDSILEIVDSAFPGRLGLEGAARG